MMSEEMQNEIENENAKNTTEKAAEEILTTPKAKERDARWARGLRDRGRMCPLRRRLQRDQHPTGRGERLAPRARGGGGA